MLKMYLNVIVTLAFLQDKLSGCLNTVPKEVLVVLGFPLTGDPNRRSTQGGDITEAWLSAGRKVINLD